MRIAKQTNRQVNQQSTHPNLTINILTKPMTAKPSNMLAQQPVSKATGTKKREFGHKRFAYLHRLACCMLGKIGHGILCRHI